MRMDEGFPAGTTTVDKDDRQTRPLNQWRVWSARDPRRSIPNRAVKPGSAEGTGGLTAGRVGPCAIPKPRCGWVSVVGTPSAAWSSGSSSGS